jgi:flagellar FliJ protein
MKRSQRLQPVAEMASNRQQEAARVLTRHETLLNEELQRLEELKSYRDEYVDRLQHSSQNMVGLDVREYRLFLQRLGEAIDLQVVQVEQMRRRVEESRLHWAQQRAQEQVVGKVIDRMAAEERAQLERREQASMDELSQRFRSRFGD